jgi:arylsulfatase A-like enzyme
MRGFVARTTHASSILISLLIPLFLIGVAPSSSVTSTHAQSQRPNILIIMTDDQGHDTMTDQFMPYTKHMIADQGINFTRGYMSTALCCPSRSSFLTGKYARHHGVHTNQDTLNETTIADRLRGAGYYTGMVGKYLNSWPGNARPEFNYWACWMKDDTDPMMNISGVVKDVPGHLTYILRDYALDFFDKVPSNQPFFLLFAPHAPHRPATPAPGDENLYSDLPPWRPLSFNPTDQSDKPKWLQDTEPLTSSEIARNVDEFRLNQLRSLRSVDVSVRDLLNKLGEQGKLDNTLVVFYSDNGYLWGEHRLNHKNYAYEEASHGPFALRYPPLVPTPRVESQLVQVIDLAPTIYELAGITIPSDVDGRSLVPLMTGTTQWRDAILLEGWPDPVTLAFINLRAQPVHYQAIRTEQFVYIESDKDKPELYDTESDPYQLRNLAGERRYKRMIRGLHRRLVRGEF